MKSAVLVFPGSNCDRDLAVAIEAVTGTKARHFCYPSGRYSTRHPEWLASLGIKSGTTCDAGLNDATTNMLLLRRYLDQENFSEIEFEASITGFSYLVRRLLPRFMLSPRH